MERQPRRRDRARKALLAVLVAGAGVASFPSGASAEVEEHTFRLPLSVSGYEVKQDIQFAEHAGLTGHITKMSVDIVDAGGVNVQQYPDSTPVPIDRLMLHHIVFLNTGRADQTCSPTHLAFDGVSTFPAIERFFAAGEERARMAMPPGYGYQLGPRTNVWAVNYMVMNHKAAFDSAFIEYKVTVDDGVGRETPIQSAKPFWMDAENCKADPIYNVPGTGPADSVDENVNDFMVDPARLGASGGRIVAGAGHVHGGAERLELSQPTCGDRTLAESIPTWGRKDHPFYNVRPILHEPGPINMTAFETEQGFPIRAGEPLRMSSVYDDARPHTRVMGIMIIYIAPDASVPADVCSAPAPTDVHVSDRPDGRTKGPVKFKVPLTGLDEDGNAVEISRPPGKTKRVGPGATLDVGDNFFRQKNVRIDKGDKLNWKFDSSTLHNLTLANGPEAIGSPNMNGDRTYSRRFDRAGTYRLFCGLHPVQMSERVVVK